MRHGHGLCLFADGTKCEGQWEWDVWVQSAACPKLSTVEGWGSARAVAGFPSSFTIKVRTLGWGLCEAVQCACGGCTASINNAIGVPHACWSQSSPDHTRPHCACCR